MPPLADICKWYDSAVDSNSPPAPGFIRVVTLMEGSCASVVGLQEDPRRLVVINRKDIRLTPELMIEHLEDLAGNDTDNTRRTVFADHSEVNWSGDGHSVIDCSTFANAFDGKAVFICYCPK